MGAEVSLQENCPGEKGKRGNARRSLDSCPSPFGWWLLGTSCSFSKAEIQTIAKKHRILDRNQKEA